MDTLIELISTERKHIHPLGNCFLFHGIRFILTMLQLISRKWPFIFRKWDFIFSKSAIIFRKWDFIFSKSAFISSKSAIISRKLAFISRKSAWIKRKSIFIFLKIKLLQGEIKFRYNWKTFKNLQEVLSQVLKLRRICHSYNFNSIKTLIYIVILIVS